MTTTREYRQGIRGSRWFADQYCSLRDRQIAGDRAAVPHDAGRARVDLDLQPVAGRDGDQRLFADRPDASVTGGRMGDLQEVESPHVCIGARSQLAGSGERWQFV